MSEQASIPDPTRTVNVNRLGYYLDGWTDIVEGMGDKVDEVMGQVYEFLSERDMPEVTLENITGVVGLMNTEKRTFITSETHPGATSTIYVGKHGKDLCVSWQTYIRQIFNKKVLNTMVVIAALIGLMSGWTTLVPGMRAASSDLVREFDLFSGFQVFLLSGGCFIGTAFIVLVIEAMILSVAGVYFKKDPLGFFFIEPNVFDATDIAAMSLSVHQSVLKALDKVGVDTALLRGKEEFYRKRGEAV